jgi:hypothetical protein
MHAPQAGKLVVSRDDEALAEIQARYRKMKLTLNSGGVVVVQGADDRIVISPRKRRFHLV